MTVLKSRPFLWEIASRSLILLLLATWIVCLSMVFVNCRLVVTEAERKKLNNLARWFAYVRAIPIFSKYQGNLFLCGKDAFKIDFSTNSNQTE